MSIKMYNLESWIERKIKQNSDITEQSLRVAAEGLYAIIRDIKTLKEIDLIEQIEANIEYLHNAEAAMQRRIALEQTLNAKCDE